MTFQPYPITFQPRFKDRVWGGRQLEKLYGKPLPPGQPVGESWEITDRPGDVSVVANGPLAGRDLHWLLENHGPEILGDTTNPSQRFPLLIKILDARQKLSLQVHPPPHRAAELGGEPKTELWFIADADPGAKLYVGLKRGVTRAEFEQCIRAGTVAECFHSVPVAAGDTMFLPSGRVHAIGEGLVIFEIQQNSDTTYRVFDWNRVGLDGQPRELHIPQSLASIDFNDFEPALVSSPIHDTGNHRTRQLADNECFSLSWEETPKAATLPPTGGRMQILGVIAGSLSIETPAGAPFVVRRAGEFCLLPAALESATLKTSAGCRFLRIQAAE